jgi:aspartate/methionine/tyrosine aminotransferase
MTAWCSGRAAGRLAPARAMPAAAAAPQPPPPLPPPPPPRISRRLAETDVPCVAATRALVAAVPGTLSLAQGVVHWPPPAAALAAAAACAADAAVSLYGPDEGLPALRAALRAKLAARNSLPGYDAIVTAGANQGFASAVLALVDAGDAVALFAPYYCERASRDRPAILP